MTDAAQNIKVWFY